MAIYVHCTEECREEVKTHGVEGNLDRLIEKVEADQSFSQFLHYPAPYFVKKKFGMFIGRLIARRVEVGDDVVLVLLAYMLRGGAAYKDKGWFNNDPVKFAQQHLDPRYSEKDLKVWLAKRKESPPRPSKPELDVTEQRILNEALQTSVNPEPSLAESSTWVDRAFEKDIVNRRQSIHEAVANLGKMEQGAPDAQKGGHKTALSKSSDYVIWTRSFPDMGMRLLINVGKASEIDESTPRSLKDLAFQDVASREDVLKASLRMYPEYMSGDYDLWANMQTDKESNLALSPEEEEVRRSVRPDQIGFPLFINGRAGSGKTTILHYIFAEYAAYHTNNPELGLAGYSPIYFTANPRLKDKAVENVTKIALRNPLVNAKVDQITKDKEVEMKKAIAGYFSCFHDFLVEHLPSAHKGKFTTQKRVTYPVFRRLWEEKFNADPSAKAKVPPAISWHVIRTYILGNETDFDDYDVIGERDEANANILEIDDYLNLEKKQRSVSDDTYRIVYEKVWPWYKSIKQNNAYWDDQDLCRCILRCDSARRSDMIGQRELEGWHLPKFTAIFCDESQDFTPVELSLLLKLSLYSHKMLRPYEVKKVPFVFAGDQFQTLNPTGFRWESIKSSYVEQISLGLDGAQLDRDSTIRLNYKELSYNYRSTREIVGFSNLIQALRSRVFGLVGEIRPQRTWTDVTHNNVVLTHADRDTLWDSVKRFNVKVIVPCGEGEEVDFINNDELLRKYVKFDPVTGVTDITVLSAASAKGLEFTHVMTYGFASQDEVSKVLDGLKEAIVDGDLSLPLQYFVNKLYVSVSRPTRCLVVAEHPDKLRVLWDFSEGESMKAIESGVKRWKEEWEPNVIKPIRDLQRFVFSEAQLSDPVQDAEQIRAQAESTRNPFLLKNAANLFRNAGKEQKYQECIALAAEYEGKHKEAAKAYEAAKDYKRACRSYLTAGLSENYPQIISASKRDPEIANDIEVRLAVLCEAIAPKSQVSLEQASKSLQIISSLPELTVLSADGEATQSIKPVLDKLAEHYLRLQPAGPNPQAQWQSFAVAFIKVREAFSPLSAPEYVALAKVPQRAQLWKEAARLHELGKSTNSPEYFECKARSSSWPENIESLHNIKLHTELVAEYDKNLHTGSLNHPQIAAVIGSLCQCERFEEAVSLAQKPVAGFQAVAKLLAKPPVRLTDQRISGLLALYFSKLVAGGGMREVLDCIKDGGRYYPPGAAEIVKKYVERNSDQVNMYAVIALGCGGDALETVDWTATSPYKRNRIIQDLKRAFPLGRTTATGNTLLCAGLGLESLGAFNDAISYFEKITTDGKVSGEWLQLAWRRWVKCHMKVYEEQKAKGNTSLSNEALRKSDEGLYSAGIKREDVGALPSLPATLDPSPLLTDFITKSFATLPSAAPVILSEPAENKPVATVVNTGLLAASAKLSEASSPTPSPPTSSSQKVFIGGLELEHFPGKKIRILAPDGTGADYSFARGMLVSTDDGVVGPDNLSIPAHGLVAQRLSDTSVQVTFTLLKISIVFG